MRRSRSMRVWLAGFAVMLSMVTGCGVTIGTGPGTSGTARPPAAALPATPPVAGGPSIPSAPLQPGGPSIPSAPLVPGGTGQGAPAPGVPGAIGTPGAAPTLPPIAALASPAENQARIQSLVATYGIKRIYGSRATGALLATVADMLRRFPVGSLRDLEICCEPSEADPQIVAETDTQAYWMMQTNPTITRMYLFRDVNDLSTLTHESGHHLTLYADPKFGVDLAGSLSYTFLRETDAGLDGDPMGKRVNGDWDASRVPAESYNRAYSKTACREHLAELVMNHVSRNDTVNTGNIEYPSFRVPAGTQAVLEAKLGGVIP